MALLEIKNLTFTYANSQLPSLQNISFSVNAGEFVLLGGSTGSGKTTLLKLIKSELAPHGQIEGEILYENFALSLLTKKKRISDIGYVFQNADRQIVSDYVYQELAFGLENLGYDPEVIRLRIGEMASFFGITNWYRKKTNDLSGGQKQLLNLASVMVMEPKILLLDEPTSQLDPIAASEFLQTLKKLNDEFGLTIIIVEHHLEELWSLVDRAIILNEGKIVANDQPKEMIKNNGEVSLLIDLPTSVKIYQEFEFRDECPLTVKEGKRWLEKHFKNDVKSLNKNHSNKENKELMFSVHDLWFRYQKQENDVLRGLNLHVFQGEILSVVGGNGSGKSTLLKLIANIYRPNFGKLHFVHDRKSLNIAFLPQNPQDLFLEETVLKELEEMNQHLRLSQEEWKTRINQVIVDFSLQDLLNHHPYDLSGGEQQKVALSKILLINPDIILLDEPSKSLDATLKMKLKSILLYLQSLGKTIIIVSHDIEFAARVSDRCAMLFDGELISIGNPNQFFSGNRFYTTNANRISRHMYDALISEEEVIALCKINGMK
ncbi:MAG: energy-coupling factor transporter ATPase [Bacilli bacterium]|nr:energy-coupling factor transporter ATPase [Bacilli bacterium]